MSDIHHAITAVFTAIAQYGYDFIRHPITNFKTVWIWGVRLAHILWACRISVLSAGAGLLIFYYVLQAQNLFADLSFGDSARGVLFWLCVFGAIFLFWAFPVHYGARDILEHDEWLVSPAARRGRGSPWARDRRAPPPTPFRDPDRGVAQFARPSGVPRPRDRWP